jgi:hypothetical protein
VTHWHFYLLGTAHRSGPWVEYLRWLQQQARLFLRSAYIKDLIANLLDSDDNNEVIDEYDQITRQGTIQLESGPFQNYMVCIIPYFHCLVILKLKFLIMTNVAHATQLGRLSKEAGEALSHSPNSATSHNMLRAFTEVSLILNFLTRS